MGDTSDTNHVDLIEAFNSTSRYVYLDYLIVCTNCPHPLLVCPWGMAVRNVFIKDIYFYLE